MFAVSPGLRQTGLQFSKGHRYLSQNVSPLIVHLPSGSEIFAFGTPSQTRKPLIKQIDWQVREGETWAIVSGAGPGKTHIIKVSLQNAVLGCQFLNYSCSRPWSAKRGFTHLPRSTMNGLNKEDYILFLHLLQETLSNGSPVSRFDKAQDRMQAPFSTIQPGMVPCARTRTV